MMIGGCVEELKEGQELNKSKMIAQCLDDINKANKYALFSIIGDELSIKSYNMEEQDLLNLLIGVMQTLKG